MRFIYSHAHLPKDPVLLKSIDSAAHQLFHRLKRLDIGSQDISDYTKKYLKTHVGALQRMLQTYSYVLSWSIGSSDISLEKFTFVDYGGGSGILSCLAKECGIGTVIYNDIYDVSCRDARVVGESIGNPPDYYVQGDIYDVIMFLRKKSFSCNAAASYDVIEHIYDIREGFFKSLPNLSDGPLTVVMSSGANKYNPLIRRSIVNRQRAVEYEDREKEWGHKERDSLRAYVKIRKEIILDHADVSEEEAEKLARVTRGMVESDIKKCVDEYKSSGKIPRVDASSNTCDPYTGNWAEHLMNPYELRDILRKDRKSVV